MESPNPRPLRALLEINKIFHQVELIYYCLQSPNSWHPLSHSATHILTWKGMDRPAMPVSTQRQPLWPTHMQQLATATTTHRWCACKVELNPSPLPPLDASPARTVDRTVQTHALPEAAPQPRAARGTIPHAAPATCTMRAGAARFVSAAATHLPH